MAFGFTIFAIVLSILSINVSILINIGVVDYIGVSTFHFFTGWDYGEMF